MQLQATHKVEMDAGPAERRPKGDDGEPQEKLGDVPTVSSQGRRKVRISSFGTASICLRRNGNESE